MVRERQLGSTTAHDSSGKFAMSPNILQPRSVDRELTWFLQIIPAESNGIDAINFRTMRDSKSVDLERNDDIIHATATSPSAFSANGSMTPGMLTPKELTHEPLTPPELPSSAKSKKGSSPAGLGSRKEIEDQEEVNPFGEFSSVTRDVGDW